MCIMACCFPFIPWLQLSVLTEAYRRRRANDPKSLPRRRRRLSLSSRCASNVDCAFLNKLPMELRLEIYTYILGGKLLHLVQPPKRLAHISCPMGNQYGYRACCPTTSRNNVRKDNNKSNSKLTESLSNGNLAFLQTCRRIYIEAIDILYNSNIFDIDHLQTFTFLTKTIPPQRLATISTLHTTWGVVYHNGSYGRPLDGMDEWNSFCHLVATKMFGLRDFRVFLSHSLPLNVTDGQDLDWIKPLLEITGLRSFHLELRDMGSTAGRLMFPPNLETQVNPEVQKLERCLREQLCGRRDTPIPLQEPPEVSRRRKLWKPRRFPEPLADLDGRMIEMATALESTNIETDCRGE